MRLDFAVLVVIAVLFTCCEVFAMTTTSHLTKESLVHERVDTATLHENFKEERFLRMVADSHDPEDRGVPVVSNIVSGVKNWKEMRDWINTGASRQTVMNELGLAGRVGEDLKRHPNYKRFREFLFKREDKRMKAMIDDAISTAYVWERLHLEQLSEAERKTSKKFQYYMRYATMYDNEIFRNQWYSFYSRPVVYYEGTPKEMFVKVGIWAEAKRSNSYVKASLNLEDASKKTLEKNPYYQQFLSLQNPKKRH